MPYLESIIVLPILNPSKLTLRFERITFDRNSLLPYVPYNALYLSIIADPNLGRFN